jgi:hypothetical protein
MINHKNISRITYISITGERKNKKVRIGIGTKCSKYLTVGHSYIYQSYLTIVIFLSSFEHMQMLKEKIQYENPLD